MLSPLAALAADDPIVGTWVGSVAQDGIDPFETRLTFVSPKGGVSRYPSFPCGGMLVGGRKGEGYEYQETLTWGGVDEVVRTAASAARVSISVSGDKMKFDWAGNYEGRDIHASGELHREAAVDAAKPARLIRGWGWCWGCCCCSTNFALKQGARTSWAPASENV